MEKKKPFILNQIVTDVCSFMDFLSQHNVSVPSFLPRFDPSGPVAGSLSQWAFPELSAEPW